MVHCFTATAEAGYGVERRWRRVLQSLYKWLPNRDQWIDPASAEVFRFVTFSCSNQWCSGAIRTLIYVLLLDLPVNTLFMIDEGKEYLCDAMDEDAG